MFALFNTIISIIVDLYAKFVQIEQNEQIEQNDQIEQSTSDIPRLN